MVLVRMHARVLSGGDSGGPQAGPCWDGARSQVVWEDGTRLCPCPKGVEFSGWSCDLYLELEDRQKSTPPLFPLEFQACWDYRETLLQQITRPKEVR